MDKINSMTKTELQNLARRKKLKGWSKYNIKELRAFLKRNIGSRSRSCSRSRRASRSRSRSRRASHSQLHPSMYDERCYSRLKKDIVKDARKLKIPLSYNGKPKTKEHLCNDIADQFDQGDKFGVEHYKTPFCMENTKYIVKRVAQDYNVDLRDSRNRMKTKKQLCRGYCNEL
ncbi:046L [Cherax quadricarinatus iridovirus]|nr:046L [Cherax quadricarinatus iridovirus]ASZ85026.1 046L [Cherax quadricarinatus iridovirus]UPA43634.1 046L [Iridovirus CN01]UPA43796.1 046L [Iridovirus CN01]